MLKKFPLAFRVKSLKLFLVSKTAEKKALKKPLKVIPFLWNGQRSIPILLYDTKRGTFWAKEEATLFEVESNSQKSRHWPRFVVASAAKIMINTILTVNLYKN